MKMEMAPTVIAVIGLLASGGAALAEAVLATARANRAKELMLLNQPNIAERIIIGPPKEVTAEQDGIPLGVSLGSKK